MAFRRVVPSRSQSPPPAFSRIIPSTAPLGSPIPASIFTRAIPARSRSPSPVPSSTESELDNLSETDSDERAAIAEWMRPRVEDVPYIHIPVPRRPAVQFVDMPDLPLINQRAFGQNNPWQATQNASNQMQALIAPVAVRARGPIQLFGPDRGGGQQPLMAHDVLMPM